jgi:hypothetical protein
MTFVACRRERGLACLFDARHSPNQRRDQFLELTRELRGVHYAFQNHRRCAFACHHGSGCRNRSLTHDSALRRYVANANRTLNVNKGRRLRDGRGILEPEFTEIAESWPTSQQRLSIEAKGAGKLTDTCRGCQLE